MHNEKRRTAHTLSLALCSLAFLVAAGPLPPSKSLADNDELKRIEVADQSERNPASGTIDWAVLFPRDQARKKRVLEIYRDGGLRTGPDYYNAALILQHGNEAEDYLLAHELSIVAMMKGEERARLLAAEAEDRFLFTIGRPQRFATQFYGPGKLRPVDEGGAGVTDRLRKEMRVFSLASAREEEQVFADRGLPVSERIAKDEKRVASDPENMRWLVRLSNEYLEAKQFDKAAATRLKAIAIDPHRADVYYDLACIYARGNKTRKALAALRSAFGNGFQGCELMLRDPDLESIRSDPDYKKMVAGCAK